MSSVVDVAADVQKRAWSVIEDADIIGCWTSVGATINLVGSLKMGLLIRNRDIDFHIYTDPFRLSDSFSAVSRLAEHQAIRSINYTNLLEAEDCIEWHAFYEDSLGDIWQIDMIHLLCESPYAGYFERVAERICAVLTDETREAILTIKNSIPTEKRVKGIEIYRAVIEGNIRDEPSFWKWKAQQPKKELLLWVP
ncbi:MAG: phosphoglycerate mutase family protein [Caldilineaceae bacterium]